MALNMAALFKPITLIKFLEMLFVICAFACAVDFEGAVVLKETCHGLNTTTPAPTPAPTTKPTTPASTTSTSTEKPVDPPLRMNTVTMRIGPDVEDNTDVGAPSLDNDWESLQDESEATSAVYRGDIYYPYKLFETTLTGKSCNGTDVSFSLSGNYSSSAVFYVFTGVTCFLLALVAVAAYVCFWDSYEEQLRLPYADLALHAVFSLFWFAGSIAWASAVTAIKKSVRQGPVEEAAVAAGVCHGEECAVQPLPWTTLDSSVVFGFLNFVIYGLNCWFIFGHSKYVTSGGALH